MEVRTIAVIGAGVMGHGITQVLATAGYDVHLYDIRAEALTAALERIEHGRYGLLRAVEPFMMPLAAEPNETIENAIALLRRAGRIAPGDKIVVATDILAQDRLVDSVQLRTVR